MAIKYEIHSIHNSKGEGGEQKFVRLRDHEPMTSKQIEQHIEQACSLTRGDVQAVMTSLHDLIPQLFYGVSARLRGIFRAFEPYLSSHLVQ